jgi:hypothetical protein
LIIDIFSKGLFFKAAKVGEEGRNGKKTGKQILKKPGLQKIGLRHKAGGKK